MEDVKEGLWVEVIWTTVSCSSRQKTRLEIREITFCIARVRESYYVTRGGTTGVIIVHCHDGHLSLRCRQSQFYIDLLTRVRWHLDGRPWRSLAPTTSRESG